MECQAYKLACEVLDWWDRMEFAVDADGDWFFRSTPDFVEQAKLIKAAFEKLNKISKEVI